MLKLYHQRTHVGDITNVSREGSWMSGSLQLSSDGEAYRKFFAALVDEEKTDLDPAFGDDLLDPADWLVLDEHGATRGVEIPAVHGDGEIQWRWR